MKNISALDYFKQISAIPRNSYNEKAICDYIRNFASERGLECFTDSFGNVLVKKKASHGKENAPTVMLQAHVDMVCQKTAGSEHDFEKDGIKLIFEGDKLYADSTTLGADDGCGVAIMLAVLDNSVLENPPLECLFTITEEPGLIGMNNCSVENIRADKIINIDYSADGFVCTSCSGGIISEITHKNTELIPFKNKALKIDIFGLKGGHSGEDADKHRANANHIMARILSSLYASEPFNLISINGGEHSNAITVSCSCIISVQDVNKTKESVLSLEKAIRNELAKCDKGFRIHISRAPIPGKMMTFACTSRIIDSILLLPQGIYEMSSKDDGVIESSANTGVVRTDGDTVRLYSYLRAVHESKLDELISVFSRTAVRTSCDCVFRDRYCGWEHKESSLINNYLESYKEISGKDGKVCGIHAGIEVGVLLSKIKEKQGRIPDSISIGPDCYNLHSTSEYMSFSSFERTYRLVEKMLTKIN